MLQIFILSIMIDINNVGSSSKVRTNYYHEIFGQLILFFRSQINIIVFELLKSIFDYHDSPIHNFFPRLNLSLSLLNLQHSLSYFGMIGNFHKLHCVNFNSNQFQLDIHQFFHILSNDHGIFG